MRFITKTILISLVLNGCAATAQFAPTKQGQIYSIRHTAAELELFRSQQPTKAFDEIGTANVCCAKDSSFLLTILRTKAAEMGGDALIQLEPYENGFAATVIRYR